MKKIKVLVVLLSLLLLTGCGLKDYEGRIVSYKYETDVATNNIMIVGRHTKIIPGTRHEYHFMFDDEDVEVDSKTFNSFEIGDTYSESEVK